AGFLEDLHAFGTPLAISILLCRDPDFGSSLQTLPRLLVAGPPGNVGAVENAGIGDLGAAEIAVLSLNVDPAWFLVAFGRRNDGAAKGARGTGQKSGAAEQED